MAKQAGRVVTKEELLKEVWAGAYVTKTALRVCVRAIRIALGDDVAAPRYLETVGRVGYRFIASLCEEARDLRLEAGLPSPQASNLQPQAATFVGREAELAQLYGLLAKAVRGERQVVFVTGEPGIGKTTVVDMFLSRVGSTGQVWVGRGQCLEQYGEGEAYLPVLEALGQLCRQPGGEQVLEMLSRYAPTWLVQMPALVSETELEVLQQKVMDATRHRMLREMAEALEALTAKRGLALAFEDLHWSDRSTLEFIAYLAQRRERARLLVVGTYRPADVVVREHPLKRVKQELQTHGQCQELRLELLTESETKEYLTRRLGAQGVPGDLAGRIHRRTDGNPLFMVNVVDYYVQQGRLDDEDMPENLQGMIAQQVMRLHEEEQQVLEGGSVVGVEFTAAAVAAALKSDVNRVEEVCEKIARQGHFLQEAGIGEWPDGALSGRYSFRHALYQNVLYQQIAEARRVRLHRLVGERLEQGYGNRAKEIAAELAVHFERSRDAPRAVLYLWQAGENALRRSAYHEALGYLTKGLKLLTTLPDTRERAQQELSLQIILGSALIATKGQAAAEVEQTYGRVRELCYQVKDHSRLSAALYGLWIFSLLRARYHTARELGEQLLTHARNAGDSGLLLVANFALGDTLFWMGELTTARAHLEEGIRLYDAQKHRSSPFLYGVDPMMFCLAYSARVLWHLGYPEQALCRSNEALAFAKDRANSLSLSFATGSAASVRLYRREAQTAQQRAEDMIALATEQGFPDSLAKGTSVQGWALVEQGQRADGIARLRQGLAAWLAAGAELERPYFLALLAEAYGKEGQVEEGMSALTEAFTLMDKTGERVFEAELHRIKGELMLQQEKQKAKGKKQK